MVPKWEKGVLRDRSLFMGRKGPEILGKVIDGGGGAYIWQVPNGGPLFGQKIISLNLILYL